MLVVLDNIRSSYNVGSILRTSDGAGVDEVVLGGYTPSKDNKISKTALGAESTLKISKQNDLNSFIMRNKELFFIISIEKNEKSKDMFEFNVRNVQKPILLLLGNEIGGVSKELMQLSDAILHLPMNGSKTSLNVSSAAAIAIYYLQFTK
jgi:tRNA G18 (ribose-2'-O)-methylase SpoU